MTTVYDFTVKRPDGTDCSLKEYQGKILLIVNTATGCGLAKQFAGLEKLHQDYKEQGFHVLGFPCKQFSGQEPVENGRMEHVCQAQFGVTFPLFAKIKVNGTEAHPLYQFLKKEKKGLLLSDIKWNFTKFLVNENGEVVERYSPTTEPTSIDKAIKQLLEM